MGPRVEEKIDFKSSIINSVLWEMLRNFMIIVYSNIIIQIMSIFGIDIFDYLFYLFMIYMVFVLSFPFRLFYTNNNLTVNSNDIVISSSLLNGIKNRSFKKDSIKEIIFKVETPPNVTFLLLCLPSFLEHKWLTIINSDGHRYTYYFYGIDYEVYYDTDKPDFEQMFMTLARNGIKVRWNSVKNPIYKDLQDEADQIYLNQISK